MKICILNSVHPVSDTRVKRITETLAEAGNEITIISPSTGDDSGSLFDDSLRISWIGLTRKTRGNFQKGRGLSGILGTILSRAAVCSELFKIGRRIRADVYHCNEMDSWIVGVLLKIWLKRAVVFDVHEYYPARMAEATTNDLLKKWIESVVRNSFSFLSRFSDGLIFVNDSIASLYKFRGPHIILRNCVRIRDFRTLVVKDALQQAYRERVIVVHIGNLRQDYGARALLESLAYIQDPEILILILGGADPGFQSEVARGGFDRQIKVVNQMPLEDMLDYLSLGDIGISLLQPIDKNMIYSLGRKFLEYIAAGLPVIVSDFPEYRALIEKYQLGLLIDPQDPKEIASAINQLVNDSSLRDQMGQNAARAFDVELNWEMESRHLFELYDGFNV